MLRRLVLILLIILGSAVRPLSAENTDDSNYVLIISSFSFDDEWAESIARAIRQEFEQSDPDIVLHAISANLSGSRSYTAGMLNMQAAFAYSRLIDHRKIPSLLILLGDEAWMYYRMMEKPVGWEDVPVIITGCCAEITRHFSNFFAFTPPNDSSFVAVDQSYGTIKATAIIRQVDCATFDLIHQLNPNLKEVVFLSKRSYQDRYIIYRLQTDLLKHYPQFHLRVLNDGSPGQAASPEVQNILKQLPQTSAIIVYSATAPPGCTAPVFVLNDRKLTGQYKIGGTYPVAKTYAKQTIDMGLRILNGEDPRNIPAVIVDNSVILNREALDYFRWNNNLSDLADVEFVNIPPSFVVKHRHLLLILLMITIVIIYMGVIFLRERSYQRKLIASFEQYHRLYNEYQIVYENMPMALINFNCQGQMLNASPNAADMLEVLCEQPNYFNLFETDLFGKPIKHMMKYKQVYTKQVHIGDCWFLLLLRMITNPQTDLSSACYLMIVIDNTAIMQEERDRKEYEEVFQLAMSAARIGICQFNICDSTGFANDYWYEHLMMSDTKGSVTPIMDFIAPDDTLRIRMLYQQFLDGTATSFNEIGQMSNGIETHWLHAFAYVMEYAPEQGRVIVLNILINIDEQIKREEELAEALMVAMESDHLKDAFIANTSKNIRPSTEELVNLSTAITQAVSHEERAALLPQIQQHKDALLNYIRQIIDISREDKKSEETFGI